MNSSGLDYVKDLLARRWLVIFIVCVLGIVLMPFVSRFIPTYKGTAELLVVSQSLKDTTLADPDIPSIITSTEVLGRVINRLKLDTDPVSLAKQVKIKLPPKSSIIELTYKSISNAKSVSVTNAIADEAVAYFHRIAIKGYADVLDALDMRIAQAKANVADADKRLQRASANGGFSSDDKALDDLTSQIDDLKAQRGQLSASLAADTATAAALKKQMSDIGPVVRGEILQHDAVYQQVQSEVGKDTADLVSERASFKDAFPGLHALSLRLDSERTQVAAVKKVAVANGAGESPSYTQTLLDTEHADALVSADTERLRATDQQLADEESHLRQVSGAGAVVGTLRGERDAALQQYVALTQRLSASQGDAAQASSLGTLVVVSRAIPGKSNLWMYLVGMSVIIFALALVAAFAVDAIDPHLWGVREIEHVYGRPVLIQVGGQA